GRLAPALGAACRPLASARVVGPGRKGRPFPLAWWRRGGTVARPPQIGPAPAHRVPLPAVRTAQHTFQHAPRLDPLAQQHEPVLRPAARTPQVVGQHDVHERSPARTIESPRSPRTGRLTARVLPSPGTLASMPGSLAPPGRGAQKTGGRSEYCAHWVGVSQTRT